jgi:repressor LexA
VLTKKQYQLLLYIDKYVRDTGTSPSYDEMRDALALRSKSGIHRLITGLEERGFIRRLAHRARAVEIVKLPGLTPTTAANTEAAAEVRRPVVAYTERDRRDAERHEGSRLPLFGRIAAGTPIEAFRDQNTTLDLPDCLLGRGEYFALEVEGDSMIEAGILNGDWVIVERTSTVENGTIVVALVENSEVTLKRLRRRGKSIALEPANPAYEIRIFGPDQVKLQGRVVAVVRKY